MSDARDFKSGAWGTIGGANVPWQGSIVEPQAMRINVGGSWRDVWTNFNPNLPSMTFAQRTFNLPEEDNDYEGNFGTQIPKSKLVEALSKGYTKLSFYVYAQCNKLYQGDIIIRLAGGGIYTTYYQHAIVGCRGDDDSGRLTDGKTVEYDLATMVNYLDKYPSVPQYLMGQAVLTQYAGYSVNNFTVSGYINNIHFTK